ncbi:hybrid sensor histidine kinase/response regulator [Rhodobium gokarnense]|uniref:histidine kinase n=1 Tax=Rhodobium gokarnense TaxID=364296 RepID=A0ABT3HEU5_9HYPH|nr:PAS domain S-box protein [Rhodobium gokarnense]MCW2308917.1 PAS domain S-box-containing protein [Rhodobium gokarnense]
MASLAANRRLRSVLIVVYAVALLVSTVLLGLYLGLETNRRLQAIKTSWVQFSEEADRKGAWISEIRGLMGYGGIIHNFKNYVLRKDDAYLERLEEQLVPFHATMRVYRESLPAGEERQALATIEGTIRRYEEKIPIARQADRENWPVTETDRLVKVDDTAAIAALVRLEAIWTAKRDDATRDIVTAVGEGERLITMGFLFLFALGVVALVLIGLLFALLRELQGTVVRLTEELAERRRAEQAERKLSRAIEQSPATIIITDTDGRIEYVNRKFETLTEYSRAEVIGETPRMLRSGNTADETYRRLRLQLLSGKEWRGIFRNRKKSGEHYWVETTILPLKDDDGQIINFISAGEDITEKRRAREQIARVQKMEAVGLLAGGIAHDFNNILTSILGNLHLARLDAPRDGSLDEELEHAELAAKRAQGLVKQLLTFARRQPATPARLRLAEAIEEDVRLLRASIPVNVGFDVRIADPDITVMVDPSHLNQVMMNLCRNAAEAIGTAKGTISITAETCDRPDPDPGDADAAAVLVDSLPADSDRWVRLSVADDGPGMPEDVAGRVFEPFYSTKPVGKGTGLGLSMVATLAREMGSRITLKTGPGEGATFSLYLPQCEALATAESRSAGLPGGRERLLLIDDEVDIVSTYRRILIRLGYQVEAYTEPRVAMAAFAAVPGRFDAVITDMVMPEMSGEEVVEEVRRLRPDCPVLIASAYHPESPGEIAGPHVAFLEKPADPGHFARTLRGLLDAAAGNTDSAAASDAETRRHHP